MKHIFFIILLLLNVNLYASSRIEPGAEQLNEYLPLLEGKRVGLFANHTSKVGKDHLIDVLLKHNIKVVKIFAPEHGFRGEEDKQIGNSIDSKTQIPIVSLYGKKLKPSPKDLEDVDVLLFDIQDVGVRFYTYISSLQKFMEAAAINQKPLIVLDRPNPNGFYVDGPILDPKYKSFTGMQPVPIVYGMTMGEYAKMLQGEHWLDLDQKSFADNLKLVVIPCRHYTHKDLYEPPIPPSPNLKSIESIYWYPSIGLMEATAMSVGRGTKTPFQVFGHPTLHNSFAFTPDICVAGAVPRYFHRTCHGWNLIDDKQNTLRKIGHQLQIKYLIAAYQQYPDKKHFFQGFAASAGSHELEDEIKAGLSEKQIRQSWKQPLAKFKMIRKHYLLYKDFEA